MSSTRTRTNSIKRKKSRTLSNRIRPHSRSRSRSRTHVKELNENNRSSRKPSKASVGECIKYLRHPDPRVSPPVKCYKILDFPDEPGDMRITPGPHYEFFRKLLGSKIAIADIITVDKSLQSPTTILSHKRKILKQIKGGGSRRYLIIPLYFPTTNNYYGVLYDRREKEVEFFIPPGSRKEVGDDKLELKFRGLLIDRLQLPIEFFYYNISNAPKPGTYHADFWSSWLIMQKILKATDRESLVNLALEKLLLKSKDYTNFTKKYTNFILQN